ncbi:MAG: AMP phosphorylase [Candidatus Thermoplasmatota archaeon]|nr:AMP phosphorylase [Candidatus Thermoplasmatota archaeon]MDP7265558.1 AMP phosphorylase [Candidatus Thermoplasmatota archaeon]
MKEFNVKRIDVDTGKYEIILNIEDARDLSVYREDRVKVVGGRKTITAKVNVTDTLIEPGTIGAFRKTHDALDVAVDDKIQLIPTSKPDSVEYIRKKMDGKELSKSELYDIIRDLVSGSISDIEMTAYVVACYTRGMTLDETENLTKAIIDTGDVIEFDKGPVFDFHSIGGLPGNKVTLLVVPIVAASGLMIPKTCSRAISSACGTADILETIANVTLSIEDIKRISEEVGGVIAWGGAVNMAPADDLIIQVEYPLAIDPYPQVISSIMAKKKAGGAEYLLIDLPMGPGTKVETEEIARRYVNDFIEIGRRIGIKVECAITFGGQPVGAAIGPALEVKEALEALEGKKVRTSLIEKSAALAGLILEAGGVATTGQGKEAAKEIIRSGKALEKLLEIIKHQGGNHEITSETVPLGKYTHTVVSDKEGYVDAINNKSIVKVVRAAGAPKSKGAGLWLYEKKGHKVAKGQKLYTLYADSERKLKEALRVSRELRPLTIEGMLLKVFPSFHQI